MVQFTYEAINNTGDTITGSMEAEEETAVVERLQKMGCMVLDIKESGSSLSLLKFFKFRKKVNIGELSLFSRQMAAMLEAGIPITRTLYTLSRQVTNTELRIAVEDAARNVEGGMNLTEALRAYPKIFNSMYMGIVRSGETGGDLEKSFERLSEQLQKEKALSDSIRSATIYPAMVTVFALLILLGMLLFLVPVFIGFFPPNVPLPLPTLIIVGLSNSLRFFWYIWVIFCLGLFFGTRYYLRSPSGEKVWDRIRFKIPVFGSLLKLAVIARFSRILSTLLEGGIPVIQALENAGDASGSMIVVQAVQVAGDRIQEGMSIAKPLDESGIFPPMVIHMVSVGEETGSLPALLERIAVFYEDEVSSMSRRLTALLEPVMLVVVGMVVGVILLALYLPIFNVVTQV
ncbi:MAG: type II secretion system F family protein [Candidatus Contubernalis sp.]|nr:type II secretion system F family protein [Candidatus Contubernalis sp.]